MNGTASISLKKQRSKLAIMNSTPRKPTTKKKFTTTTICGRKDGSETQISETKCAEICKPNYPAMRDKKSNYIYAKYRDELLDAVQSRCGESIMLIRKNHFWYI